MNKFLIVGITLLAFILRIYRLDYQSYWIEEGWTLHFARMPLDELLVVLQTQEIKPPFYYVAASYWLRLAGESEFALRYLSLIFSVLAIPLTYRLGKSLGDARVGLVAAVLMAVAPYQIWHAQEGRLYSILTTASIVSLWAFVAWWRVGGWRWWLIYVLGTLWAIYTHYHALAIVGVQGLFLLITWRRHWRGYLAWGATLGLIGAILAPWFAASYTLIRTIQYYLEQPTLWETYQRGVNAYTVGELLPLEPIALIAFGSLYLLGVVYAGLRRWRDWSGWQMVTFLLVFTLAPNLATWLYGEFRTPAYLERYLIMVQVGFLLAVAMGIIAIADGLIKLSGRRALGYLIAMVPLGGLVFLSWSASQMYYVPPYAKPDWRAVVETIEAYSLPGDAIIITGDGGEKVFDYYYDGDLPLYLDFHTPVPSPDEARAILQDIAAEHQRIWYSAYGAPIDTTIEPWLRTETYPAWHRWLGRKQLALYGTRATTASLAAGDVFPFVMRHATDAEGFKVSTRLLNNTGDVFAQSDWPPVQPGNDPRALWIPPDTPPGMYQVQSIVYNPVSGEPESLRFGLDVQVDPAPRVFDAAMLPIPNRTTESLGPLNVVGYTLPESIQPGLDMWLWVYWQAETTPSPDTTVTLSLSSDSETSSQTWPLSNSVGDVSTWQPGQVRRAVYHLPTSPRLGGESGTVEITRNDAPAVTLDTVRLLGRSHQFDAPSPENPLEVTFGEPELLELVGYDRPNAIDSTLPLALYWQAQQEMRRNYTLFVHLLDEAAQIVAQRDRPPKIPTQTWLPGEFLSDTVTLNVGGVAPGTYRVIAGMYDPHTGARLPVSTGGDFVELGMVTIEQ